MDHHERGHERGETKVFTDRDLAEALNAGQRAQAPEDVTWDEAAEVARARGMQASARQRVDRHARPGAQLHPEHRRHDAVVLDREALVAAGAQEQHRAGQRADLTADGVSRSALAAERARIAATYGSGHHDGQPGRLGPAPEVDDYDTALHARKTRERSEKYLNSGPKFLRPWRRFSLRFIKQGIPPE